ncbi:DUF397 domain-containing protein [Actinoallomurus rhizosphaericola]
MARSLRSSTSAAQWRKSSRSGGSGGECVEATAIAPHRT